MNAGINLHTGLVVAAIAMVAVIVWVSCASQPTSESIEQMKRYVAEGALLVDVRSAEEFSESHLPQAKNIPVDQVQARLAEFPKDRKIVVYCRSGRRSAQALDVLKANGFEAYNLGAMSNWNADGNK